MTDKLDSSKEPSRQDMISQQCFYLKCLHCTTVEKKVAMTEQIAYEVAHGHIDGFPTHQVTFWPATIISKARVNLKPRRASQGAATMKIRLTKMVRGDFPIGPVSVAGIGIYDAEMNPHGALSVIDCNGNLLGVKPGEFEFVDEIPEQWKGIYVG